jgi:hypothetical protein
MDQIAFDNLLLELSGNMILPVLVRGFALQAVATEDLEPRSAAPTTVMATISHYNERLLNAIRHGEADRALSLARSKDAIMKSLEA